jgi:hypothetical protein
MILCVSEAFRSSAPVRRCCPADQLVGKLDGSLDNPIVSLLTIRLLTRILEPISTWQCGTLALIPLANTNRIDIFNASQTRILEPKQAAWHWPTCAHRRTDLRTQICERTHGASHAQICAHRSASAPCSAEAEILVWTRAHIARRSAN